MLLCVLLCDSRCFLCISPPLSPLLSLSDTKEILENIHITAPIPSLSWMLISLERYYIFSASKTPATVINRPLAVMEMQTFSLFPGIDEITEPWDGHQFQTHFPIHAALPLPFPLSPWFASQTKIPVEKSGLFILPSLFLHGTHFHLLNKKPHSHSANWCHAITTISAICAFYSKVKFTACQNISLGDLASHVIFFSSIKNLLVHSSPGKAFKLVCVLGVYERLLGPPPVQLQPLLCSVNWTFGYKRLRNSRPNR